MYRARRPAASVTSPRWVLISQREESCSRWSVASTRSRGDNHRIITPGKGVVHGGAYANVRHAPRYDQGLRAQLPAESDHGPEHRDAGPSSGKEHDAPPPSVRNSFNMSTTKSATPSGFLKLPSPGLKPSSVMPAPNRRSHEWFPSPLSCPIFPFGGAPFKERASWL